MNALKPLKKAKGFKGLPTLGKKQKLPPLPAPPKPPEWSANQDDELLRLTRELGSRNLAKKIMKMKEKKYPDATLPELVALEWLERRGIPFTFQQSLLGGRVLRGGQVVDLVVNEGPTVIIIEIMGSYWHTTPGKRQLDAAQKLALLTLTVFGKRVRAVVEAWESRLVTPIESRRNAVMNAALSGQELGQ